jgi:Meiosis-expressed
MNDKHNTPNSTSSKLPDINAKKIPLSNATSFDKLIVQRVQKPARDLTLLTLQSASVISDETGSVSFKPLKGVKDLIGRKLPTSKPFSMQRAKVWSLQVENTFRYQLAGYTDESDYYTAYGEPACWSDSMMIRFLIVKLTGYFMYFRNARECEDKHLNKVKLYTY